MTIDSELEAWRLEGARLRERLLEERQRVVTRIDEIGAALDEIDRFNPPPAPNRPLNRSVPSQILSILAGADRMKAGEILSRVQSEAPTVTRFAVYSALYQMTKRGRIQREGHLPSFAYSVNRTEPAVNAVKRVTWRGPFDALSSIEKARAVQDEQ